MIALTRSRQLILVSVFSIPMMVAVGAMGHLVSLEASAPQPLVVPALEQAEPTLSIVPSLPESPPAQTDLERQNAVRAQLQDADWLVKRGQLKAAKSVYQALLDRSDSESDADLKALATQRLEKLEQSIVAIRLQDQQRQDKLKAEAKKKSKRPPEIKSAIKTPTKPTTKPTIQAVKLTEAPIAVSSPDPLEMGLEMEPQEFTSIHLPQPSSAIDLTGTRRIGQNVRFEQSSDLTTEPLEAGFGPGADRVTPRLVPNSVAE
jgi:hypothetical protein